MQLIGLLHVVFDALAFRNDVGFWKGREDLRGLSSRGVIFNAGSTLVIFLYLLDGDGVNSIVLATYAFSTALELWKLTKVVAMRRRARGAAAGAGGEGARAEAATERFDEVATRHLTWGLAPLVVGWALYALLHYPHASWRAASPPSSRQPRLRGGESPPLDSAPSCQVQLAARLAGRRDLPLRLHRDDATALHQLQGAERSREGPRWP